jgi:hypothetical protein
LKTSESLDSRTRWNWLCEPNLHVFAKLFEDRLRYHTHNCRACPERAVTNWRFSHRWSSDAGIPLRANGFVLNGKPLDRDISAALELSVRLENDANCFAISEAIDGAAAGYRVVFGVILGTGVGGGIVIDHRILTGLVARS